jgi:hypothetical protein
LASGADLEGTFVALLSATGNAARDRIAITGPVLTIAGDVVAESAADLWDGEINTPIEMDETGDVDNINPVWTGTTEDGDVAVETCADWTSGDSNTSGRRGTKGETGGRWLSAGTISCGQQFHLYCIEQ